MALRYGHYFSQLNITIWNYFKTLQPAFESKWKLWRFSETKKENILLVIIFVQCKEKVPRMKICEMKLQLLISIRPLHDPLADFTSRNDFLGRHILVHFKSNSQHQNNRMDSTNDHDRAVLTRKPLTVTVTNSLHKILMPSEIKQLCACSRFLSVVES